MGRLQLAAGGVAREYTVLCHGWIPPPLQEITARVYWRAALPTSVGEQGKPARTRLKLTAHLTHNRVTLSLVAVKISTGRRHQIRSHFSHIGHPTLCDRLYASLMTFHSDRRFCARNFLHRYRLAFSDAAGS